MHGNGVVRTRGKTTQKQLSIPLAVGKSSEKSPYTRVKFLSFPVDLESPAIPSGLVCGERSTLTFDIPATLSLLTPWSDEMVDLSCRS